MPPRPPLPPIDAPLPETHDEVHTEDDEFDNENQSTFAAFKNWLKGLLKRDSPTFQPDDGDSLHKPFSLRQCCNWGNIRTRLLLLTVLDLLASMYGLASANRVRLISPILNMTGLMVMWILMIGMMITCLGIVGILQQRSSFIRIFFYWSLCSLVLNFGLSCVDLQTIDDQCDFIWNNFDHSAYAETDRQLFARQCSSYAFVFFSTIMVGLAFARLYYVWQIRNFYISITPEHEQYGKAQAGFGYQPVHSGGGTAYKNGGYAVNHYEEDEA